VEASFNELRDRLKEITDINEIAGLLSWDQQTIMPRKGAAVRGAHLSTLAKLSHEMFTDDAIGKLIDASDSYVATKPADSFEAALHRLARREWTKARQVPTELASELVEAGAAGYNAWLTARPNNDFASFLPFLEKNIELKHRYIECFKDHTGPAYDLLLDDFEEGLTGDEVTPIFDRLKVGLRPLIDLVNSKVDSIDDSALRDGDFDPDKQKAMLWQLISVFGVNADGWRLDPTAHPFASGPATTDIRITTRYNPKNLAMALYGTIHETGHGLYEEGIDPALERTPLCRGCSMILHESQSRLLENMVGRSRPFLTYAFPLLEEYFPGQFDSVETIYRAANKMQPSLIRVEADELTYPLHIIIRFEIERDLFGGNLQAKDLPEAWNAKVKEYLGIDVPNDTDGVLQDVHWSDGLFGYFPTYALGTIVGVQIWERIRQEIPDLDEQFVNGSYSPLREWLRVNLHQYGRKFTPKQTIDMVAGGPIDAGPFLRYITAKVEDLYGPVAG
jgi:carboxypeptidase Taq